MRVSVWRRGIGRPQLSVRAKATGDEPQMTERIEQRRANRPRVKQVVLGVHLAGASRTGGRPGQRI